MVVHTVETTEFILQDKTSDKAIKLTHFHKVEICLLLLCCYLFLDLNTCKGLVSHFIRMLQLLPECAGIEKVHTQHLAYPQATSL